MGQVAVDDERSFDILGLGAVAVDDLLYVAAYPAPDEKVRVLRRERHCGGLTATALVTAARLGARCTYAGVVGEDDLSSFALHQLEQEGVDTRYTRRRAEARIIYATVVVGAQPPTRNIFFDLNGVVGADPDWPPAEIVRASRVLLVDHIGVEGMLRAARLAGEAGIPIVADLENDQSPHFPELLALVDHLILSRGFAHTLTGHSDPASAALALWSSRRRVVAVTCGEEGAWYVADSGPRIARHQPTYPVNTVDSTGCGDVFHGAYAFALARGLDVVERMRVAAAAAALKATRPGGQAGIPSWPTVKAYLELRS
ncbi:MAG TPA: PfkB family carbohydrate kinase [Ardenticatenaceae bacterium]|nr:PfkB family carbohydrate kinase [Ardenticatenaceae bacterium]